MKLVLLQPQLNTRADNSNNEHIATLTQDLSLAPEDIVLLPEHHDHRPSREDYRNSTRDLSQRLGAHVVGGSHHDHSSKKTVNSGVVTAPSGDVLAIYEKLRPYAAERERVQARSQFGEICIGGVNVMIVICADFWFSDLFLRSQHTPDLILVPALSVTRKPTPQYSRQLWQHMAVARVYEFGAYVGISDWGHPSELGASSTSGVAGFADPTSNAPDHLFQPLGDAAVQIFELDME